MPAMAVGCIDLECVIAGLGADGFLASPTSCQCNVQHECMLLRAAAAAMSPAMSEFCHGQTRLGTVGYFHITC